MRKLLVATSFMISFSFFTAVQAEDQNLNLQGIKLGMSLRAALQAAKRPCSLNNSSLECTEDASNADADTLIINFDSDTDDQKVSTITFRVCTPSNLSTMGKFAAEAFNYSGNLSQSDKFDDALQFYPSDATQVTVIDNHPCRNGSSYTLIFGNRFLGRRPESNTSSTYPNQDASKDTDPVCQNIAHTFDSSGMADTENGIVSNSNKTAMAMALSFDLHTKPKSNLCQDLKKVQDQIEGVRDRISFCADRYSNLSRMMPIAGQLDGVVDEFETIAQRNCR